MESMIGNTIERAIADAGYCGHNAPLAYKFKVYTAGQRRRVTPQIKREMKRRAAVEPVAISKPSVAWPQSSSRPPRRRCHQCRVRRRRIQLARSGQNRATLECAMCLYAADGKPVLELKPAIMMPDVLSECIIDQHGRWCYLEHRLKPVFMGGVALTLPPSRE